MMKHFYTCILTCCIFALFNTTAFATNYIEDPEHEVPENEIANSGTAANLFDNPNTGDYNGLSIAFGMLAASIGVIGYTLVKKEKQN